MPEENHSEDGFDDNLERMLRRHPYGVAVPETVLRTKSSSISIYISFAVAAVVLAALGWWKFRPAGSADVTASQGAGWASPIIECVADREDGTLAAILRDGGRDDWRLFSAGDSVGALRVESIAGDAVALKRGGKVSVLSPEGPKPSGRILHSTFEAQGARFAGTAGPAELAALADSARIGDPGALALLKGCANDPAFGYRADAERLLGGGSALSGLERICATARDRNSPVRNSVLAELAKLDSPLARRALLDVASDASDPARDLAMQWIARTAQPGLAGWMRDALATGGLSAAAESELRAALRSFDREEEAR